MVVLQLKVSFETSWWISTILHKEEVDSKDPFSWLNTPFELLKFRSFLRVEWATDLWVIKQLRFLHTLPQISQVTVAPGWRCWSLRCLVIEPLLENDLKQTTHWFSEGTLNLECKDQSRWFGKFIDGKLVPFVPLCWRKPGSRYTSIEDIRRPVLIKSYYKA